MKTSYIGLIRFSTAAAITALIISAFSSCKKLTEDQIINGLWVVNQVNIDTFSTNYLDALPHFPSGNDCCNYKLDFERDGVVLAYYLTFDTFSYVTAGNWEVTKFNQVYINVDRFIDGTFDITKPAIRKWKLESDANHIKAFDGINPLLDTTYTKIQMEKL